VQAAALVLLACSGERALAQSAGPATNQPGNYSNLVTRLFLQRAEQIARALTLGGFIPAESFTNVTVRLEGQSVNPSGQLRARVCAYDFRQGVLGEITRSDLYEDKGPESLILRHLTNEVLTLKPQAAAERALDLLGRLSLDVAGLRRAYRIRVSDDLMDAYPIRNGGPNFPKELHFFGELISRRKIRIVVGFAPARPKALADCRFRADMRVEFLATTGELRSVRFADPEALALLGLGSVEPIVVPEASDFGPPVFVSATRKLRGPPGKVSSNEASQLLAEGWQELRQKLGINQPQCYLLCDNLNAPEAIARQVTELAGKTPWAGFSHWWRDDLPFERAQMNRPDKGQRGLALLAVGGRIQIQLELLRGLGELPNLPDDVVSPLERRERVEMPLAPRVSELLERVRLPDAVPDHAVFLLTGQPDDSWSMIGNQLRSRVGGRAEVFSVPDQGWHLPASEGIAYFRGAVATNAVMVMRVSGFLPLRLDGLSLLARRPEARIVSGAIARPLQELAASFGPHPMQGLFDRLGPDVIQLLQEAERVEVFRIKADVPDGRPVPRRNTIEGQEIIARGKPQGRDFAKALAAAILNENATEAVVELTGGLVGSHSARLRGVAFRVWRGEASATLIVWPRTGIVGIKLHSETGKQRHEVWLGLGENSSTVGWLAQRAFSADAVPNGLIRPW
jgi:hypothetical protein